MALDAGALVTASLGIVFLVASGLWAERRFSTFNKLPMQYGITGTPNKMGGRHLAIWLPTGIFALMQVMNIGLLVTLDPELINGDPEFGLMLTSTLLVGAQILILWLHLRWARTQG